MKIDTRLRKKPLSYSDLWRASPRFRDKILYFVLMLAGVFVQRSLREADVSVWFILLSMVFTGFWLGRLLHHCWVDLPLLERLQELGTEIDRRRAEYERAKASDNLWVAQQCARAHDLIVTDYKKARAALLGDDTETTR